jgi:AcrR family transcriptional regulator
LDPGPGLGWTPGWTLAWAPHWDTYVYSDTVVYPDFMIDSPAPRLTRRESQELTRRRLIESASELFASHGVRGTSLIAVAERAGFSRGAVHGNFSDKDDLAAAVVEFVVEDLGPALGRALVSPGSTNERLAAYISTHIDYCRAEPTRAAAIIAAVGYLSRPAAATASQDQPHGSQEPSASQRQAYGQRSADSVGDLVALFEEGQRSGQMRSFDPTTMALSLRSVLDAAVPTHPGIEAHEIIALFDHATRAEEAPS